MYHRIFSGTPEKECRKELENMLLEILSVEYGNLSSKDILLAEFNKNPCDNGIRVSLLTH